MNFKTLPDFLKTAPKNAKITFLIRHAERRHILPEDADNGAHVPITKNGAQAAFYAGSLFPQNGPANYVASPVFRCRQTAAKIAQGRGDTKFDDPEFIIHEQKLAEFFVKDYDAYLKTLEEGFYEGICEYLKSGSHAAYKGLEEGSLEMLELVKKYSTEDLNFAVTHDAWIVPCLKYFCGIECTPQKWLNFMSGIAFIFEGDSYKAEPVTFMDSGFLIFGGR